jgi:hypothetical protein
MGVLDPLTAKASSYGYCTSFLGWPQEIAANWVDNVKQQKFILTQFGGQRSKMEVSVGLYSA